MHLFQLHCSIRCQSEGDPDKARHLCQAAGLDPRLVDMISRSTNWRADPDGFRASAMPVFEAGDLGKFWPAVAAEHMGAIATEPAIRIVNFDEARDLAGTLHHQSLDRTYVVYCANAELHDTEGGEPSVDLDDIVTWMTEHGVYNAPGRAEVLIAKLIAEGEGMEAFRVYARILARSEQPNAFFSPNQLRRLEASVQTHIAAG